MGTALMVLHIDGLGADSLEKALRAGLMPFTQHLIDAEGYEIHRYRCGLPAATPFVQAGILYGDNTNIPSWCQSSIRAWPAPLRSWCSPAPSDPRRPARPP